MPDTNRNSVDVETCPTPEQVMEALKIPKSTYYEWMQYLGEKAVKQNGRAYLTNEQFDRLKELKMWVDQHGKKAGFLEVEKADSSDLDPVGELAVADSGQLADGAPVIDAEQQFVDEQGDRVFREAAKLAAHRIYTVPALVVDELAQQMTAADIPAEITAEAQANAAEVINPKSLNPQAIAARLLEQRRRHHAGDASLMTA